MKSIKAVHLTSAHPRYDIRIFMKECLSLRQCGHHVTLVVADGKGSEDYLGIDIVDVGKSGPRWKRFLLTPWKVWQAARSLKADIYHFHDSELLIIGLLLRLEGARVIYDSHEDLPRQILSKYYIKPWLRKTVSFLMEFLENFISKRLSGIVAATPHIGKRFIDVCSRVTVVNNYPLMSEVTIANSNKPHRNQICYIGGVTRIRGILEMVRALHGLDVRLVMAGPMENNKLLEDLKNTPGWENVEYLGSVSRERVFEVMSTSMLGMLLYLPEPNHTEAQPNKLFEYMGVGLPVLASDFPLWRELVVDNKAGICVNPNDVVAIHTALKECLSRVQDLQEMGARGRVAVRENLNWSSEEAKLVRLYSELMEYCA